MRRDISLPSPVTGGHFPPGWWVLSTENLITGLFPKTPSSSASVVPSVQGHSDEMTADIPIYWSSACARNATLFQGLGVGDNGADLGIVESVFYWASWMVSQ